MCSCCALRSNPPFWSAAAPLMLTAGAALLQLFVLDAAAGMHEATEFSVRAGSPDEYMQAGAAFAGYSRPDRRFQGSRRRLGLGWPVND
jgi:hypothetical protein